MARILLADDDSAMRDFARRALVADGHHVTVAAEGAEALQMIEAGAALDLLITDVQMPALDGLSLAERLARSHPGLPILLVSGYAVDRERLAELGANIVGLLQKPVTLDQLRAQTRLALRAG